MDTKNLSMKHGWVFGELLVLSALSVAVHSIHLSAGLNNILVFGIAFAMAALVLVQYMGLRRKDTLLFWTFLVPVILFAILVVLLIPDIAHHPFAFLEGL